MGPEQIFQLTVSMVAANTNIVNNFPLTISDHIYNAQTEEINMPIWVYT